VFSGSSGKLAMNQLRHRCRAIVSFCLDWMSNRRVEADIRLSRRLASMIAECPDRFATARALDLDSGAIMLLDFLHESYGESRGREIAILVGSERWYYQLPGSGRCRSGDVPCGDYLLKIKTPIDQYGRFVHLRKTEEMKLELEYFGVENKYSRRSYRRIKHWFHNYDPELRLLLDSVEENCR